MLFNLLVNNCYSLRTTDSLGNIYEGQFETLFSVFYNQKSLQVLDSVTRIYGKGEDQNAFINCRDIVTVTFSSNSQLSIIEPYAFYFCQKLESIDLSVCHHLVEICTYSFYNCRGIQTFLFPDSLKHIRKYALASCVSITQLVIPINVVTIEDYAFNSGESLTSFTFAKGIKLTTMGSGALNRAQLSTFEIPASMTQFEASILWNTPKMATIKVESKDNFEVKNGILCSGTSVIYCPAAITNKVIDIPSGITTIEKWAFHSAQIDKVTLPDTVVEIKHEAFRFSSVNSITMTDNVTTLGTYCFADCPNLNNIVLSNNILTLPDSGFYNSGLTSITLPSKLIKIEASCFRLCKELKQVTIPAEVTGLGGGAFSGCPKLDLDFESGSPFSIDSQGLITKDGMAKVYQYIGSTPNAAVEIPASVTCIEKSSFANNIFIQKVTFAPDSLLKEIGDSAFNSCGNLTTFEFPQSLEKISGSAFKSSGIVNVEFGQSISSIYKEAFSYCKKLEKVVFKESVRNLQIYESAFYECTILSVLKLPEGLSYIDKNAFCSIKQLTALELPSTLERINESAFSYTSIQTVTFATSCNLKVIGTKAFYRSESLQSFQFAEGIEVIETLAFYKTALTSISLSTTIKSLKDRCFKGCGNLQNFTGPKTSKLETIDDYVFQDCLSLKLIDFTNANFKTINNALFIKNLSRIIIFPPASETHFLYLPGEITLISPGSFYSCTNLQLILMPDNSVLSAIGAEAFYNCVNLRSINLPISVNVVGTDAFKGCTGLTCGQIISNNEKQFREDLVKVGKMPKFCLEQCRDCNTCKLTLRSTVNNLFLTSLVLFLSID